MSYLRYACFFVYSDVQHIMCCVFVLFFFVYAASFYGLSIFDCSFGILYPLFILCALCCQFLWTVDFLIAPSVFSNVYLSCVPYAASFYGLLIFYCSFGVL